MPGTEESIKVAVRARPLNQREKKLKCDIVVSMSGKTVTVSPERNPKHFTYDYTFWSVGEGQGTQEEIFEDIGTNMVSNAVDGFNCTLFAYGQTGSGKSYTMMGGGPADVEDAGVIPRMINGLFEEKDRLEEDALVELQVRISYLEIYKEQVTDLFAALSANKESKGENLKIMEHPKLGVYVKGLYLMPCATKSDVMSNLEYGLKMRTIAATNMNQSSSRSHAVFTIIVNRLEGERPKGKNGKDERKSLHAKINLIDLAGSERTSKAQTENERLKEGCAINQSLSQLGLVIKMLTEQSSGGLKAPMFRASKLTFLLKDSLAGNSKTCMMATVSPASDNYDETVSTLRFASSVKSIKTVAVQNKNKKDQLIDNLQQEMRLLKAQMAAGGLNVAEASEQLKERERLIKEQTQQDFQEELKAAREMSRAREKALEESGLSHGHITEAFGISNGQPYMVNMAFDPMLAGCLIYLIQEHKPTTMGANKENTIVLKGLGMPDFLCRIDVLEAGGVSLTRLSDGTRVAVNGKLLEQNQMRELQNGDRISLGRTYVLKLVYPGEGAALNQDDLVLQRDDTDTTELENSPSWKSLQDYVGQVVRQMSAPMASTLMEEIKQACRLTDEANEVTVECRSGSDALHFEVDLTSTFPPCVTIRVLYCDCDDGPGCTNEEHWKNKYIWSVSQLAERLERMRDYWRQKDSSGAMPELPPLEDPWHEAEAAEIFQRMRHLESVVLEAEKAFKVSQESQPLMLRIMNSEDSLRRLIFGLWKSCVSAGKRERKASTGRAALVKTPTGRMRTTIVLDKPLVGRKDSKSRGSTTPQATSSGRRKTLKFGAEKGAERQEPRTPRRSAAQADPGGVETGPAQPEPEATPEEPRRPDVEMVELQRQLDESCQQKAAMEHQLEVAYELVDELRGRLVDTLEQKPPQPQPAEPSVVGAVKEKLGMRCDPELQPNESNSCLLAQADALALASRAALDAAKAVQRAKYQSGIAALPWSSSRLAARVTRPGLQLPARSVSPATPRTRPVRWTQSYPRVAQVAQPGIACAGRPPPERSQPVHFPGQPIYPVAWAPAEQPTPVLRAPTTFIQPGRMGMGMTGLKMVQVHQPAPQSTPASPSPTARTPRQYPDPAPYWGTSSPRLPNATAPAFYAPPLTQSTSAVSDTSWLWSQPDLGAAQAPRSAPLRRPSSSALSTGVTSLMQEPRTSNDGKAEGSSSGWFPLAHAGVDSSAECLKVAPDLFLVRVPDAGAEVDRPAQDVNCCGLGDTLAASMPRLRGIAHL
ncbi:KIF13B [Symbiodinium natans]|uniref:KIF13B protein n=1 Tax=Symbiodinium natans TaxID=878477 RepID=A0A812I2B6_9DINO|nr:KIF13B [Symbiodinium natans]